MTTKVQLLCLLALSTSGAVAWSQASASAAKTPPPLSPTEQTIKEIKNPASWMTWGADIRIRNEYFNNAQTLTSHKDLSPLADLHSQDYFRFRGRIWTSIRPMEGLSLNARLAAEPREWMEPSSSGTYSRQSGMEWRYGIFDNLNVQWKGTEDIPLTVTVGRQDLLIGDGWLVADGTPIDGSWTYFLDAARFTYNLKEQKTTIDLIGIFQYSQADAWMPIIPAQDNRYVTDSNEKGAILYVSNKSLDVANADLYFVYKHDRRTMDAQPAPLGDNANIYTLGTRISGLLQEHVKYSVEGAYQFGEKQDPRLMNAVGGANQWRDMDAFGVNAKLTYMFKDSMNNQLGLAFEYLSGDNPSTEDDEMFDLLWGRWPRWSKLYNVYSYVPETRVAQSANFWRIGPAWSITPFKNTDFLLSYNALFADESVPTRAPNLRLFTQDGSFRGHYLQTVLKYKFSQHLAGHLWGEWVWQGDYYASEQLMTFLRAELMFTF